MLVDRPKPKEKSTKEKPIATALFDYTAANAVCCKNTHTVTLHCCCLVHIPWTNHQ